MATSNSSFFSNIFGSSRYRNLVVSIGLFLFLILVLLVFTFYTSDLLRKDTALVNKTGFVSKSSEVIIKDLFDLQGSYGESIKSPHIVTVHDRLEKTTKYMNDGLRLIESGGTAYDDQGHTFQLDKATDEKALEHLKVAKEQWALLEPKIQRFLSNARDVTVDSESDLNAAVEQAKTSSLLINDALSALSRNTFGVANGRASLIRLIQLIGVAIILAYFAVFIFFFIRRLRESDKEAIDARRETEEIMQTVNTGLFLLDKNLIIGNQYSKALSSIIGNENLAGENLTTVLRNRVSDKDLETTKQFIDQLYNPRVKTKLINDLNPLNKVMIHNDSAGTVGDTYLDFKFSRVYEKKEIARILVNVNDVTDAVMLEKRLEQEREQNDEQMEMLTTILNVHPDLINGFIVNTNEHIDNMNNVLKNPGSSQFELENKLKSIYREAHSLKGEASSLKLHSFTQIASELEEKLHTLQNRGKLSGNDFLPLTVHLDELMSLTSTIETLGERINQSMHAESQRGSSNLVMNQQSTAPVTNENTRNAQSMASNANSTVSRVQKEKGINENPQSNAMATRPDERHVNQQVQNNKEKLTQQQYDYYANFVEEIAFRQNKKACFKGEGIDFEMPSNLQKVFKDIMIQLVRNSVVHGIEKPETRVLNGKPEIGVVTMKVAQQQNTMVISVEDDGEGINYPAIRSRLVSLGYYTEENSMELTKGKLLNALFSSGFSTKAEADEDGGRGVGLDIIKARVKEVNGKINVHSEPGKSTKMTITLPLV